MPKNSKPEVKTRAVKVWAAVSDRGSLRSIYGPGVDRDEVEAYAMRDERVVRVTVLVPVGKRGKAR